MGITIVYKLQLQGSGPTTCQYSHNNIIMANIMYSQRVQTAQVISSCCSYGGHGRLPQRGST